MPPEKICYTVARQDSSAGAETREAEAWDTGNRCL